MFCSNTLTLSREIQRFSHGQFSDVQIILTDVCRRFLRNKLMQSMPIVCNKSLHLYDQEEEIAIRK